MERMSCKVSKFGHVYKGDYLRAVEEMGITETMRIGINARAIGATRLSNNKIAVAFTKDGNTYVKALKYDHGKLILGNTVNIFEGEEFDNISMIGDADRLVMFYNEGSAGEIKTIDYKDLVGTVGISDIFDVYMPYNICATRLSDNRYMLCYVRTDDEYAGKAIVNIVTVSDKIDIGDDLVLPDSYNNDVYFSNCWSIRSIDSDSALIVYYKDAELPTQYYVIKAVNDNDLSCIASGSLNTLGSLPTNAIEKLPSGMLAIISGISKIDSIDKNTPTKNVVSIEGWYMSDNPVNAFYGTEDVRYSSNIGHTNIEMLGDSSILISYMIDDEMMSSIIELSPDGLPSGDNPSVPLNEIMEFGKICCISRKYAMYTYRKRDGNVYVSVLERMNTVMPCNDVIRITNTAIEDGSPGDNIDTYVISKG